MNSAVTPPRTAWFMVSHSSAGGAQEIWANLAEGFHRQGDKVQLMALYPMRETVREAPPELPWRYVVPVRPTRPTAQLAMLRTLIAMIRREKPDVIFTAMPAANVMAALAARIAGDGTRVVLSHHSPAETHNPMLNRVDSVAGSLSSVSAIVSVSDTVGRSLDAKPAAYRAKRITIHNALPPSIESLLGELDKGVRSTAPQGRKVVATGRLARQKNYPLLVRAATHMPDVTIDIVGNGPDEDMLKGLARDLDVDDRVHFLGHRRREDAMRILAGADVFAQVSLFEGHSLGLIEAAKLGLPLVVSDVPVQIEGITATDGERCGIAVGVNDEVGLAHAILGVLDNGHVRARLSGLSRKLAENATFDAMVAAYRGLLP
ncbi:glycosyltransferase [Sphingomonas sp. ID0503]|uniref:glycosyltransferase n=1 Tax=Sphingomonas sp. ID0503 TaxID=3399691 RepID=UPI003AFAEF87